MSPNSHIRTNDTNSTKAESSINSRGTDTSTMSIPDQDPDQDYILPDPTRKLEHLTLPDYTTPPMGHASTFDGLSSVCDSAYSSSTAGMSDVDHLPSPIHPNIRAPPNSRGSSSSVIGHGAAPVLSAIQTQTQTQTSLPSSNYQLFIKKTRPNSRDFHVTSHHQQLQQQQSSSNQQLQSAGRSFSEFTAAEVLSETSKLPRFNIRPVQRISSIPVQSPFVKERELLDKRPVTVHDTVMEENDNDFETATPQHKQENQNLPNADQIDNNLKENIIGTYTTFDHETSEKQTWNCFKEIGQGSFSKVYLTVNSQIAIKVTNIIQEEDEETKLRIQSSLIRELEILQSLKHPNIVQLIGSNSKLNQDQVIMALKYYPGGDLFSFLLNHKQETTPELIRNIFANIVSAVKYLHHNSICHRDIKLENVLISYEINDLLASSITTTLKLPLVVLSDFGLSKRIDPKDPLLSTRCGSEDYVSPELLLGLKYDGKQNDCWSLGVLLYTMLEDRLPFDPLPSAVGRRTRNKPAHRIALISWDWYYLKDENLANVHKDAIAVVNGLLVKRNKRSTVDDVYSSDYCRGLVS